MIQPHRQHYSATAMEGFDAHGRAVLGDWWQKATCRDVDCPHYLMGWKTMLDETDERMKDGADWIRFRSGLAFTESHDVEGLTVFVFPPGQRCFREHMEPTGKPGKLSKRTTDGVYQFTRPQDFNESMNEEADQARRVLERG